MAGGAAHPALASGRCGRLAREGWAGATWEQQGEGAAAAAGIVSLVARADGGWLATRWRTWCEWSGCVTSTVRPRSSSVCWPPDLVHTPAMLTFETRWSTPNPATRFPARPSGGLCRQSARLWRACGDGWSTGSSGLKVRAQGNGTDCAAFLSRKRPGPASRAPRLPTGEGLAAAPGRYGTPSSADSPPRGARPTMRWLSGRPAQSATPLPSPAPPLRRLGYPLT
jgi:hypothetical protein